jgi:hypothetical protein
MSLFLFSYKCILLFKSKSLESSRLGGGVESSWFLTFDRRPSILACMPITLQMRSGSDRIFFNL